MGAMTFSEQTIGAKGYVELSEPCCGSGAMILGFAKAMLEKGYNYCAQLVVTATDVDLNCVYMAYLQLSLYGIPAIAIHGNSLTNEEFSRWYTPVHVMNGWRFGKR
jgi:methylase of polypeptide subunit release factors